MKVNHYRLAPTWLYRGADSRMFRTQEEVDAAWKDGWYGPPNFVEDKPPISTQDWETKKVLIAAVEEDPRYVGLELNEKMKVDEIMSTIISYEDEHGLIEE